MRKVGILGTAKVAHATVVKPGLVQVIAVASRSETRAQAAARDLPSARALTGYQTLLDQPDVEAVYLSLPSALNATWAEKAAAAGKHVLVDKPLARTVQEVDRIAAAARAANVTVMEAMPLDFHSWPAALARSGPVQLLDCRLAFGPPPPDSARRDLELGGGAFWDAGPYFAALMDAVFGQAKFEVVQARGWGWRSFACELQMEGDRLAKFLAVFEGPPAASVRVVGPEGELSHLQFLKPVTGSFPVSLQWVRQGGERITIPFPPSSYLDTQLAAFLAACEKGHDAAALERARRRTAILETIWRAAGDGR
jgi:predicted dehydrogenase